MAIADAAVELTAALVATDTVNPALVPGAPGERPAVELLARRLEAGGFEVEIVGPRERPSLLATARGRGGGSSLALNGHLDTVGAGAMADPFTARIDGDRMTGRGSCDMKGGVAAMVVAAEQAAAAGTGGDVVLALVADEEHGSIGTEAVLDHLSGALPDACIVGEPTWLDVAVAHRGFAVVEVELTGRAAHSSRPEEGANAVGHLGRLLAAVEAWDGRLARRPPHPHAGRGSLMATVAHGGEAPFSLAATARAVVERRTVPGEPPGVAVAEVEAILAALSAQDPAFEGRCRELLARDPWQASGDASTALLLELIDAGMEAAGRPAPRRFGAPYWMESALWQAAGVPTVVWGPAGGGLHADDEWLDLRQLRDHAVALSRLVAAFCA